MGESSLKFGVHARGAWRYLFLGAEALFEEPRMAGLAECVINSRGRNRMRDCGSVATSSRKDRSCAGFWTPAGPNSPRGRTAGVQKAPGREVAVSRAAAGSRALWGFQVCGAVDGARHRGDATRAPALGGGRDGVRSALGGVCRVSTGAERMDCRESGREGPPPGRRRRNGSRKCPWAEEARLMTCRTSPASAATSARSRARRPR